MITYWFGYWGALTGIMIILSFSTFILTDPKYYNIPVHELGGILGTMGTIEEFLVIVLDLVNGLIFDLVGRKLPISIGMFVAGIGISAIPMFSEIYPGFFICRASIHLGT